VLARKCGVDPEKVFNAIRGGLAGSTVLEAKMPMILNGNFKPGFRIELHIKDLVNVIATANDLGIPVPLTGIILEFMQALKIDGKGGNDHGGLIQYYERMAGTEVRKMEQE
ncbi:MAG: NAD-binding protein, partial [Bacteroidales bacterium]|nr:NAD-binding protein [Bacteroidales bacterium]